MKHIIVIIICISFGDFVIAPSLALAQGNKDESKYPFIENKGQWHPNVEYKSEINSGALFLEKGCLTYVFTDFASLIERHGNPYFEPEDALIRSHAFKMQFKGSSPQVRFRASSINSGYYNYFLGNHSSLWTSNVRSYGIVNYNNIYNGIDINFYTKDGYLKYDYIISPGAVPSSIQLVYEGLDTLYIENEDLVTVTSLGEMLEQKPVAYQNINGKRSVIACNYKLTDKVVSFVFPNGYDNTKELVIDPTLVFSTYSGSTSNNFGLSATYDEDGFLYSGSITFGQGYPTTTGAYDTIWGGGNVDIALTKFDTSGTFLIWSTFLGGSNVELPHSLIVNGNNELYCFGTTGSQDFPVTPNAYDTSWNGGTGINLTNGIGVNYDNGSDIIVSKLSADGSQLLASTYIGGSANDGLNSIGWNIPSAGPTKYNYDDEVKGEVMLQGGNVYLATCTRSNDFPIVGAVYQNQFAGGELDAVIVKLDGNLSNIIWSSYLGGEEQDAAFSIDFDNNNDIYVVGGTSSDSFPVTANVLDSTFTGLRTDGFITHITQDGMAIINSTYWGSDEYDQIYFVKLDKYDNVYVYGQTEAPDSTLVYNALFCDTSSGQFISKIASNLDSVLWSTVFGTGIGAPNISPTAFFVDCDNNIYISGWGGVANQIISNNAGYTTGMQVTLNAFQGTTDGSDIYMMVMREDSSDIVYASFIGGNTSPEHLDGGSSRFDDNGVLYHAVCTGCWNNSDFPTSLNAYSATNNSSCNLAVFKFDFELFSLTNPPMANFSYSLDTFTVTFTENSINGANYYWDFGDGDTSSLQNPVHIYPGNGTYLACLTVSDSCSSNTYCYTIVINCASVNASFIYSANNLAVAFTDASTNAIYYYWDFGDNTTDSIPNPIHTYSNPGTYWVCFYASNTCIIDSICDSITIIDVGIKQSSISNYPLTIYPNPTEGQFTISSGQGAIKKVDVYDLFGRKVLESKQQEIDMRGFAKGVYFVRVGEMVRKLMLH